MPVEVVDKYELECTHCQYKWKTRHSKISAICPACNKKIHISRKYNILAKHTHQEMTPKETKEVLTIITISVLSIITLLFLSKKSWVGFLLFLIITIGFIYLNNKTNV